MKPYETMIGLEVHIELKTASKIFCGCKTAFGANPNTQVCPVCLGFPGALPVLNRKVVEHAVAIGLALHCDIAEECYFDRKNYYYPDNPQNYQISQLYVPVAANGFVTIEGTFGEKIIRIHEMHMEEDAGKLIHDAQTGETKIDYNRSGVPLVEIVTEPDFSCPEEVVAFLEKLRLMVQYLEASDCRMQEGSLRVDVNLSVKEEGSSVPGVRTEMKNLNSFRSVEAAIKEEEKRQIAVLSEGGSILQETRRWDEDAGISHAMRPKETTADYRYFPDPDLPPVRISAEWLEQIRKNSPEFREEKIERYQQEYKIPVYDAQILTSSVQMTRLFEETIRFGAAPKEVSNWLMTEAMRLLRENGWDTEQWKLSPKGFAALLAMVADGKINRTIAKEVFEQMFLSGIEPGAYVTEHRLFMEEDEELLQKTVERVLSESPKSVEDFRAGKEKALGFLVGQTMKAMGGKANPATVTRLLRNCLQIDAQPKA